MITKQGAAPDYCGPSTEEKPATAEINAKFLELDTGYEYYFTGESWVKIGG